MNLTRGERSQRYLQLVADTALVDAVGGPCSSPEVGKAFNGEGVAAVPVTGNFEVQVAVVCLVIKESLIKNIGKV